MGSGLLNNLVHYYQMTEAPINYADSGSNPLALSAFNAGSGVSQVAGHVQATATRTFNNGNSNDGISSQSNAGLDFTGDGSGNTSMSYCCWFNLVPFANQTFKPAFGAPIFGIIGASAGVQSFVLRQTAANTIQWLGTIQGGGGNGAVTTAGLADSNWHLFVGGFDFPNGQIWASFDGGARVNAAMATWNSFGTQPFIVMNWGASSAESFGIISDIGIWNNRILNSGDIARLWNGSSGIPFSQFTH